MIVAVRQGYNLILVSRGILYFAPNIAFSKYVITIEISPKMNNAIAQPIHAIISYPFGVKLVNILGIKKTTIEAINKN